jgi:Bacterial Ig-like domain
MAESWSPHLKGHTLYTNKFSKFSVGGIAFVLAGALSGCGGGGGTTAAPTPVAAPATLVSTTPANTATRVSTSQTVQMVFNNDLDSTTVSGSAVRLVRNGIAESVTTSYDSFSRTLTITPANGFAQGAQYTVSIPGVRDLTGAAPTGVTALTFKTFIEPNPRGQFYNADGSLHYFTKGEVDSSDNLTRFIYYKGLGPDGTMYTPDDEVDYYVNYQYDARGNRLSEVTYEARGVNGVWFDTAATTDDAVRSAITYIYNASGMLTGQVSATAGPDGRALTADDVVTGFSSRTQDANGYLTRLINFTSVGTDGVPFTADDLVGSFESYTYNARGAVTQTVKYARPGPDGLAFTTDDVVDTFSSRDYTAAGIEQRFVQYSSAGPDGRPFTADDVVSIYNQTYFNALGVATHSLEFDARGADNLWLTADDRVSKVFTYTTTSGRFVRETQYSSVGPDGVPLTADDVPASYIVFNYDAAGNRSERIGYIGAGPDGIWFNGDDIRGSVSSFLGN